MSDVKNNTPRKCIFGEAETLLGVTKQISTASPQHTDGEKLYKRLQAIGFVQSNMIAENSTFYCTLVEIYKSETNT